MSAETMRQRFVRVISELLDTDQNLSVVLADIGVALFQESGALRRHPDRIVNVGIREQLLVSLAAGMALEGFRPIVHTYAPFLVERPFEQLKLDFGHQGVGGIFVSVGASYDAAAAGRTHQAPEDVALLTALPNWTVHVPGHPDEVEAVLRTAVADTGCVYIRLSDEMNTAPVAFTPGNLHRIREASGPAATVIAVGPMLDRTIAATADMEINLLYTATPHPLDEGTLRSTVRDPAVIVVEPYQEGTSASAVSAALSAVPHRLLSVGVPRSEHRRYGSPADHAAAHGLDVVGIRARIRDFLRL